MNTTCQIPLPQPVHQQINDYKTPEFINLSFACVENEIKNKKKIKILEETMLQVLILSLNPEAICYALIEFEAYYRLEQDKSTQQEISSIRYLRSVSYQKRKVIYENYYALIHCTLCAVNDILSVSSC